MNLVHENYLKTILSFELEGQQAAVSTLAESLSVKPASVTEMIKKLSALNLLTHKKYKGFQLTDKGRKAAMQVLRRHRLWETFLFQVLKYSWCEIHEEAENFEHVMSARMEKRIDKLLSFPKFDPHGHPIPSAEGRLPQEYTEQHWLPLSSLDEGQQARIMMVSDEHPSFLNHLDMINLSLDTKVKIINKLEFDQSMEIEFGKQQVFISRQMADKIMVLMLNKD